MKLAGFSSMDTDELVGLIFDRYYDTLRGQLRGVSFVCTEDACRTMAAVLHRIYTCARDAAGSLDALDSSAAEIMAEEVQRRSTFEAFRQGVLAYESAAAPQGDWEAVLRRVEAGCRDIHTAAAPASAYAKPEYEDIFSAMPEIPEIPEYTREKPTPVAAPPSEEPMPDNAQGDTGTAWLYNPPAELSTRYAHNGRGARIAAFAALLVLFTWVAAGALMSAEVLPRVDIGYTWFNREIFMLF